MVKDFKEIINGLYFSKGRFIKYQLISRLFIAIILLPLVKIMMMAIMNSKGISSISNGMITKYLFSLQGIASIVLMILFGIFVVLVEIGGLIIMSHQTYIREKESSYLTIFKFTLTKYKDMLGIYGALIAFAFVIVAPFLGIGYNTSVFNSLQIPGFVKDYINVDTFLWFIYSGLITVAVVCAALYIFTMHFIILKDKKPHEALKLSRKLVMGNFKIFLKNMFGVSLALVLSGIIVTIVALLLGGIVYSMFMNTFMEEYIITVIITLFVLIISVLALFLMPFESYRLTMLFYKLTGKVDHLELVSKEKHNIIDKIFEYKKTVVTILGVSLLIVSAVVMFGLEEMDNIMYDVKVTAHRGSSFEAPENTMSSIEIAISNGADYVEIDVQEIKDGSIILIHDNNFKRTSGYDADVWELTLEEVKKLDSGSWFSDKFKGEKFPTLEEVIEQTRGRIKLNIEVKSHGHEKNFVESVAKIIKKYDYYNDCVVTSLDYELLDEIEKIDSKIKTGRIMYAVFGDLSDINVDFYSMEESYVNEKLIKDAHNLGREVHVWTINDKSSMEEMIRLGVDNIITDKDKELKELVNKLKKSSTVQ